MTTTSNIQTKTGVTKTKRTMSRARFSEDTFTKIDEESTGWIESRRKKRRKRRVVNASDIRFINVARGLLVFISVLLLLSTRKFPQEEIIHKVQGHNKPDTRGVQILDSSLIEEAIILPRNAIRPQHYSLPNPSQRIPEDLEQFYTDSSIPLSENDVPIFWHILKSGGTTFKDMYGECFNFVEASESGVLNGHINDPEIGKVQIAEGGITYANVDTTTPDGISRAKQLKLVESEAADIIFTPLLHESAQLFNGTIHKGRIFCIFRHPIERAISLFHYLKKASWEPTFSERLKTIETVEDYAISEFAEDNWLVRFLTNKMTEHLSRSDLEIAKEILRRKVQVGLLVDVKGSFKRFNKYFGWDKLNLTDDQVRCTEKYLSGGSNANKHDGIKEGGMGWRILRANNLLDLELYEFALQLYEEQGERFN